jgi:hypothetical protein
MKKFLIFALVLLVAAGAGWYLSAHLDDFFPEAGPTALQTVVPGPPAAESEPAERLPMPPRHPVAPVESQAAAAPALPAEPPFPQNLDEADPYLRARLPQLIPDQHLLMLLDLNYFIQKLVLFVDHLPEKNIPRLYLPFIPPEAGFVTSGKGEELTIGKTNMLRYLPYVKLVEAIPDALLLHLYRGLYPLFQLAYREAGAASGHFNDRLIEAFDDLLQTPEPESPIKLVPLASRFRYADPDLEARSAGQKILLRMGVENTRRVKQKLQSLRQALARKDW